MLCMARRVKYRDVFYNLNFCHPDRSGGTLAFWHLTTQLNPHTFISPFWASHFSVCSNRKVTKRMPPPITSHHANNAWRYPRHSQLMRLLRNSRIKKPIRSDILADNPSSITPSSACSKGEKVKSDVIILRIPLSLRAQRGNLGSCHCGNSL